ncbi:MAG: peptide-methionine (S)-S-oxide reductase MsrA [Gemmatimonadota bacterium]|nr:peptide-methionine (S)-S-oxide reductase MsrA [Gemmatimonadota bacterium]
MKTTFLLIVAAAAAIVAAALLFPGSAPEGEPAPARPGSGVADTLEAATFAGGCFWCVEEAFDAVDGVVSTTSGFTGGHVEDPSYEEVSSGGTGHAEAVRVTYASDRVTYRELLDVFWHNVDPTDAGGQFCDRGSQYRSAIFVHDAGQRRIAEASKERLERTKPFEEPIVTPIEEAGPFWPAERYHQDYHEKRPIRYKVYKFGCGRERRLVELWGESR